MELIQFNGEKKKFAEKNIINAFVCEDAVIFNESYVVIGEQTKALKIQAMYDLTIIGNLDVNECEVHGSLTIIGDAHILNLNCYRGFICKGDLSSEKIYVGGNMTVGSIVCDVMVCDGTVVIQTTVDVNQAAHIAETIVAIEGIIGAGEFSAQNAIANEYFDFDGECSGKILELETDKTISEGKSASPETIEQSIELANQKIIEKYDSCNLLDEEQLMQLLRTLSKAGNKELRTLPIVELLFSRLVEMSYHNAIDSIEDYLTVLVAKGILPDNIFTYESVGHVGRLFLAEAQNKVSELSFNPVSVEQFARTLSMAVKVKQDVLEDWDIIMDCIFESVGLKYKTVNSMLQKNKAGKNTDTE